MAVDCAVTERRWLLRILLLCFTGLVAGCATRPGIYADLQLREPPAPAARRNPTQEAQFGDLTVRIYSPWNPRHVMVSGFEVLRNGRVLCRRRGHWFSFAPADSGVAIGESHVYRLGKGGPSVLAVWEWTGGAHAMFLVHLVELGDRCRIVASINGDNSVPVLEDVTGDGTPEIRMHDWTFSYFPGCFAGSPAPAIILKWTGQRFAAAADLMSTVPPSDEEMRTQVERIQNGPSWGDEYDRGGIPRQYFQDALELMYAGHEDLGWRFLAEAWPTKFSKDEELLREFSQKLAGSRYWRELQAQRAKQPSGQ